MTTTSLINFVQNLVHAGSLIGIGVIAILIVAGLIRPSIFKHLMRSFTDRKYIAGLGIFLCLFSATVFVATDSPHRDLQQQEKQAPAQTTHYEQQPETNQPAFEEAQVAPANPGEPNPGAPTPNSRAVQGAQVTPEMGNAASNEPAPQANENAQNSAGQTAQAETPKSECKIRLLKVVCL